MSDQTVVNVSTHPDSRPPPKPKASKPVKLPKPPQQSSKLRGLPKDPLPVKISKTVSYLLRHGAVKEGLGGVMRKDGYLPVQALVRVLSTLPYLSHTPDRQLIPQSARADVFGPWGRL